MQVLLLAGTAPTAQQRVAPSSREASPLPGMVEQHCASCHNSQVKNGGLDLESIRLDDVAQHRRCLGKGCPKTSRATDASRGKEAAGGEHLRHSRGVAFRLAGQSVRRGIPIPAEPTRSGGSTAPNTRTPSAICWRLDIDAAALLPKDEASHGFDNVTVGDLSPTLLDRYISAAQKISRLAVGAPRRSPGGRHVPHSAGPHAGRARRRAADRHSRRRFDSLHISARWRVRNPDPADARPQRGSRGPARAARVGSAVGSRASEAVHGDATRRTRTMNAWTQELKVRIPVTAGPHQLGVTFLKNSFLAAGNQAPAVSTRISTCTGIRGITPAIYQVSITGPYDAEGSRRHAQPPPDFRLPANKARRRGRLCRTHPVHADAPGLSAAGDRRGSPKADGVLSGSADGGRLRGGDRNGLERGAGESAVSFPRRTGPRRRCAEHGLSHQRPGTGVAPVVLPLEQHSGRRIARTAERRRAAQARGAGATGAADAGGSALAEAW